MITSIPSSGIALDTSTKAAKKPPTQEQRDRKNEKLRIKRAAAAASKQLPPVVPPKAYPVLKPLPPAMPPAPKPTPAPKPLPPAMPPAPKLAQDAMPKTIVKGRASQKAPKNKGGRRSIYGEAMHTVSFKCTKEQHATYLKAGGNVYLRARLDELTAFYAKGGK